MKTELGATYKDVISGFIGVAIGRVVYITGCNQVLLQPACTKANESPQSVWFDEQRLTTTGVGRAKRIVLDNGATPGCAMPAPKI